MPYFLSENNLAANQLVQFNPEELRHLLLSRRIKTGEQILVQGPDGKRFLAEVKSLAKRIVDVVAARQVPVPPEPALEIILFQAVVSERALDFILQKATELGASAITLFNCQNTAAKLSAAQFLKKAERWRKILWEAAKQCERGKIPELNFLQNIDDLLLQEENLDNLIILDPSGKIFRDFAKNITLTKSLGLCVGPEGGFTEAETKMLCQNPKSAKISLGPFLLRAETAAVAALAASQLL